MNHDMLSYYANRASEYERIYSKPERENDLEHITGIIQRIFKEKEVLEIACGTGYWTERLAKAAASIKATDINESVLAIAKAKHYSPAKVSFERADIFKPIDTNQYQSLFAGFIWSHIKIQDLPLFIEIVNSKVLHSGTVVFVDNKYVEGSSSPIVYNDNEGNTYQERRLDDGSKYCVVKNFPSRSFIEALMQKTTNDWELTDLEYYWILRYKRV